MSECGALPATSGKANMSELPQRGFQALPFQATSCLLYFWSGGTQIHICPGLTSDSVIKEHSFRNPAWCWGSNPGCPILTLIRLEPGLATRLLSSTDSESTDTLLLCGIGATSPLLKTGIRMGPRTCPRKVIRGPQPSPACAWEGKRV